MGGIGWACFSKCRIVLVSILQLQTYRIADIVSALAAPYFLAQPATNLTKVQPKRDEVKACALRQLPSHSHCPTRAYGLGQPRGTNEASPLGQDGQVVNAASLQGAGRQLGLMWGIWGPRLASCAPRRATLTCLGTVTQRLDMCFWKWHYLLVSKDGRHCFAGS